MNRKFFVVLTVCMVGMLLSCASMFYRPVFVLSLHEFSDVQESRLTVGVRDTSRKYSRKVMKYGFLTARSIVAAEVYGPAENGKYGLRLQTDRWYARDVKSTAGSNSGMLYAVLLDGEYLDCAHFTRECYEDDLFVIEPIFNEYTARQIAEHAERNRNYFDK